MRCKEGSIEMGMINGHSRRDLLVAGLIAVAVVAADFILLPNLVLGLEAGWRSLMVAFAVALVGGMRAQNKQAQSHQSPSR